MILPTLTPENHADLPPEVLSPEISVQWLDGGRILMTRAVRVRQQAFDLWEAYIRHCFDDWPPDRFLCTLYDLRDPQAGFTLQMGTKVRRLIEDYPHIRSATAVLYTNRLLPGTLIAVLRLIRQSSGSHREFFTDYATAIAWLQKCFDANGTTPETGQNP